MSERKYLLHRDAGYIVSLERQAAKQYRREQGNMSGRQFRKARKAGQRAAREAARQAAQATEAAA
jgi:hypothetical protein